MLSGTAPRAKSGAKASGNCEDGTAIFECTAGAGPGTSTFKPALGAQKPLPALGRALQWQKIETKKALRAIGCTYLAYQVEQYLSSKKKSYDGSDTLKMTGVDCIRLEEQVEKFVEFFLRPGQAMSDVSCLGLRKLVELLTLTREITKEMRALTTTTDRIEEFKKNVEKLLQKINDDCPAECSKVPYLHALRDHVAALMEFWHTALGWGYEYFSCMASEHLNKLLKEIEYEETNFGNTSLLQAVVKTRIRAFF